MEDKKVASYAEYIGINRAVNPGIRVLIDFLSFYFEVNPKNAKSFKWDSINEKYKAIMLCKEENEEIRNSLYESAKEWIRSYATFRPIDGRNSQEYLVPLTPGMLLKDASVTDSMRNILNTLLYSVYSIEEQEEIYNVVQEKLYYMLYSEDAQKGGYEELLNILAVLFDRGDGNIKKTYSNKEFTKMEWKPERLAQDFKSDLWNILDSKYLIRENIYKRINELNIFLNFYIVRYMISRSFEDDPNYILAKGSLNMPAEGKLHSAAIGNFANIREQIYRVSEHYYYQILSHINADDKKLILEADEKGQDRHIKLLLGKEDIWEKVRTNIFRFRQKEVNNEAKLAGEQTMVKYEDMILDYLGGKKGKIETNNREIAYVCMEISKKRASSVRRVSAVFSSQGKECYFAYPIGNVQQKYYAMSSQLTEVLVHLFLSEQEEECGTLEMLYQWLIERYSIYIGYSADLTKYLRKNAIEQPSQSDFDENQRAFIKTLEELNCIIKLADNSYMITFDNEKGRW